MTQMSMRLSQLVPVPLPKWLRELRDPDGQQQLPQMTGHLRFISRRPVFAPFICSHSSCPSFLCFTFLLRKYFFFSASVEDRLVSYPETCIRATSVVLAVSIAIVAVIAVAIHMLQVSWRNKL